ncbi:conjugal transfer protein TraN [Aliarcobacter butzleri]|uniref:conjugal transfer protein TraN n=1 Tax=Aliarcobacter butzleri TaxID=28197 RepID=UPI00263E7881|nr:conjugal transfer protein TraN [Aliarcobacter butzleri]MDN5072375.1 conjugal transfer protein TraN [Aliarcobacter butzleri]MDN5121229.1 conjugal transfer protein TraN [Aliarcobacter butzleri]
MKFIFILMIFLNWLNAMNCSDYKDFQLYNGHYYSVSVDRLTFESAKQIAKNNGGYLAIPNSQAENDFIKGLISGGSIGWIGIEDPNKIQNYCFGSNCVYDSSRFRDVKGNSLIYKNFAPYQPDNLVKEYDEVDGKQMVSPLGEHWVAMNGNNGKWYDFGNHADEHNNPVKYKAVFEFDKLNECKPLTDDGVQELTGRFCNTKIWDSTIDTVTVGKTLDCQTDKYGNEYCPSALSQCGEQWDYENGYAVSGVGQVVDYTKKETNTSYTNKTSSTETAPLDAVQIVTGSRAGSYAQWNKTSTANQRAYVMWVAGKNGPECWNGWKPWEDFSKYDKDMHKNRDNYYHKVDNSRCEYYLGTYNIYGIKYICPPWAQDWEKDETAGNCKRVVVVCPDGYTETMGAEVSKGECKKTVTTCPNGYTETTGSETAKGECKRTVEYTYYNYLCNNSQNSQGYNYLPINSGGNTGKIDPNNTTINNDLSTPLNSSTSPVNNCKRQKFTCLANAERPCSYVDNQWQCSPFPCFGKSNLENLDTQVGIDDKNNDGWSEDGSCAGTIYIFNGKSNKCRTWDMFFGLIGGGCCDKEKVFAGLVACKENEKILAKKREEKQTHYIGNFCSKKLSLGLVKICVQKSDSYCAFNSSLARIIQEQGREQLGISWGSAESPKCRGFTVEEFQKIDFSKIDLTEFVKDIQSSFQTSVIQNLGTYVKDKVGDFYGN